MIIKINRCQNYEQTKANTPYPGQAVERLWYGTICQSPTHFSMGEFILSPQIKRLTERCLY